MKKLEKIIMGLLMSVVLTISLIVPSANAQTTSGREIPFNRSNFTLKVGGKEIENGVMFDYAEGTPIDFSFSWSIDDAEEVKKGDYSRFKLPDILNDFKNGGTGSLSNTEGDIIADWVIEKDDDGSEWVRLIYTDYYEGNTDEKIGGMNLTVKFDLEEFKDDVKQTFPIDDQGVEFEVVLKPKGSFATDIAKNGKPNKEINPDGIIWTVYANTKLETLKDGYIEDDIPDGLDMPDLSKVKVYKIPVGLNSSEAPKMEDWEDVTQNHAVSIENRKLKVDLGDTSDAYVIVFETPLAPGFSGQGGFSNTAQIYSNGNYKGNSWAWVEIKHESIITKVGVANKNGTDSDTITWTIDINKAQLDLGLVTVEDVMKETISNSTGFLSVENILVEKLVFRNNQWQSEAIEDFSQPSEFPFELSVGKDVYRITVTSKIDFNHADYRKDYKFENKVTLSKEDETVGETTANVDVERSSLLEKAGEENNPNFKDPSISWKLNVNKAKQKLKNITVYDKIAADAGHELDVDSLKVYVVRDGKEVEVDKNNYTQTADKNGFTINLGDINEHYIVKYTTKITEIYDAKGNERTYSNSAGLRSGDGTGTGAGSNITSNVAPKYRNQYSKQTVSNGVDYNALTFDWTMTVSALKEPITSLEIVDTFRVPHSMLFLENTLKIKKGSVELVKGVDYILDASKPTEGFKITFENELARENYTISFKTSFNQDLISESIEKVYKDAVEKPKVVIPSDKEYFNDATFNYKTPSKEGSVEDKDNKYSIKTEYAKSGNKYGYIKPETREITWTVNVNLLRKDFSGKAYNIKDIVSPGHEYILQSLKVYETVISKEGNIAQKPHSESNPQYTWISENKEGFEIQFEEGITTSYQLVYTTKAIGISQEFYKNQSIHTTDGVSVEYEGSVNYTNYNKYANKEALNVENNQVFIEDEIEWKVTLNKARSEISKAVFKDTISKGHVYLNGSLVVTIGNEEFNDYELLEIVKLEDGSTQLILEFGQDYILKDVVTVKYSTVVVDAGFKISNKAQLYGEKENTLGGSSNKSYTAYFSSGGWASGKRPTGHLKLTKETKNDLGEKVPVTKNPAKFVVTYELNGENRIIHNKIYETNAQGIIDILELPYGKTYELYEIKAPNGYTFDEMNLVDIGMFEGEMIQGVLQDTFDLNKDVVDGSKYVYKNVSNDRILIDVDITKEWVNGPSENRPTITLQLIDKKNPNAVIKEVEIEGSQQNTISHTFENLPKTDIEGNVIEYKVVELPVKNYDVSYGKDELSLTNTYRSPKTDITGTKVWVNGPKVKPDIELQLYRDGEAYLDKVTLKSGEESYTWSDLDVTDSQGVKYVYTIKEVDVPENYTYEENGLTVSNTYVSPKTEKTVTKLWVDGDSLERPVITVQLFRNGEAYLEPVELNGLDDDWTYTWTDLDLTDLKAVEYVYTVEEIDTLNNYGTSYSEDTFTITNKYMSPLTDVVGHKVWVNGAAVKPTVTLQLMRNGEAYLEPVELENGTFDYVWKDLEVTDNKGIPYQYTVKELDVPENYEVAYVGMTVTNTYLSPTVDKTVNKLWLGGNSLERPVITVQLLRNGEAYLEPVELGRDGKNWSHTWTDLDLTDLEANDYIYTVKELSHFSDYDVSYSEDTFTITNEYISPKTDITGIKVWINGPKVKPDIELQLYRDGEAYLDKVTLKSSEESYTWSDLDVTDIDGIPYVYTIKELDVPENYEVTYDGMTVTNTYINPLTDFTVEKQWVNATGKHPDIKVQLYKDGVAFGKPVVLKHGTTSYTWKDLDLTDENAVEHVYTVDEVDVPLGYAKVVNGNVIVNTFDRNLLPQTGSPSFEWLGAASVALGAFLLFVTRKKKEDY